MSLKNVDSLNLLIRMSWQDVEGGKKGCCSGTTVIYPSMLSVSVKI